MTSLDPFDTAPDAAVGTEPSADHGGTQAPSEEPAAIDTASEATDSDATSGESAPAHGESAQVTGDAVSEGSDSGVTSESGAATAEASSADARVSEPEPAPIEIAEPESAATEETAAEETAAEPEPEPEPTEIAEPESAAAEETEDTEEAVGEVELSGDEELVAVEDVERGPTVLSPFDRPGDWFVVHTYSGYENKVKNNLASRVRSMGVEERIHEVVIPMEDVIEFKGGRKTVVQKKVFPGYLLVRMDLDDNSWYVVRNTPGVTGFVGSGAKPTPLSRQEVEDILGVEQLEGEKVEKKARPRLEFEVGDQVRVAQGNAFADFDGTIAEIDEDRARLKVLVNIFGRETPVELAFHEVSKV